MKPRRITCRILAFVALLYFVSPRLRAAETVQFNRDIRPILSDHCLACHGPDKNSRKADLRLDVALEAVKLRKGKAAVVPGRPEESEMMRRIRTHDEDEVMPPSKTGKKLKPAQVDLLARWISEGAGYEGHWAFQPPVRPQLRGAGGGAKARQNPIDLLVRDKLQREGLQPSPEASRTTLIRRLSFDLRGLPPSPAEVDRFEASRDPEAYKKLVEQYLASPNFGERMAIHWLDLVRYADTIGYHGDVPIEVWPYRDYVIRAFNTNLPFDQFTREQLAGDLIPNATPEQKAASAYNRLNRMSTEGGVQDKEFLAKYASDRVRTTATVWMGATLACAECHDHKFDPFTTRDFYQFAAFFSDLKEKGFYDKGFSENDWGPRMRMPTREQAAALDTLDRQIAAVQAKMDGVSDESLAGQRAAWESRMLALDQQGLLEWTLLKPLTASSAQGTTLTLGENRTITAGGANPDQDVYEVTFKPGPGLWTAMRLETLTDEMFPGNRIARGGITFVVTDFSVSVHRERGEEKVPIVHVIADMQGDGYSALAMIDGQKGTGWGITAGHSREHQAAFRFGTALATSADSRITVRIAQESAQRRATIGKFRISLSTQERPSFEKNSMPEDVLKALRVGVDARNEEQKLALRKFHRRVVSELEPMQWQLDRLKAARGRIEAGVPATLVSEKTEVPRTMRILARGNWMDENGEVVKPDFPSHFNSGKISGRRATRLDLAGWLASSDNPLTARAFVNRVWKQFFGMGFTRTPEDLGAQGDWPVQAALFDWLSCEFMEPTFKFDSSLVRAESHRWDIKHLVRLIVTSETYRQSSASTSALEERDPMNRLLARQSRLRLDAELVRDNALSISGLLENKVGGPSVRPFQPEGYYAPLNFPKREYVHDVGRGQYRRGLYTHWQRTFLHPALLAFDAPSREECTAGRVSSNTPQQALVLLNDPVFFEAARQFAAQVLGVRGLDTDARIRKAWKIATGREARAEEVAVLSSLLSRERERLGTDPQAVVRMLAVGESKVPERMERRELAAWTTVARTLLNLHETIIRP